MTYYQLYRIEFMPIVKLRRTHMASSPESSVVCVKSKKRSVLVEILGAVIESVCCGYPPREIIGYVGHVLLLALLFFLLCILPSVGEALLGK